MKKADNTWIKDPPTYPPIKTDGKANEAQSIRNFDLIGISIVIPDIMVWNVVSIELTFQLLRVKS